MIKHLTPGDWIAFGASVIGILGSYFTLAADQRNSESANKERYEALNQRINHMETTLSNRFDNVERLILEKR